MKREYKTTEFWTLVALVIVWLLDRWFGGGIFDQVNLNEITDAKAQVLALAAELRGEEGTGSTILLVAGFIVYAGRKIEKIVTTVRSA